MSLEIRHKITDAVLYTSQRPTLREALEEAAQARANLARANLAGAYLAGAYLADANLADANLAGANLADANLARANLADANLAGANLAGAYLADAKINWQSHAMLSEILWRAAKGEPAREQLAAWIGRKTEWCWKDWMRVQHHEREWAIEVLAKLAAGDQNAPEQLRIPVPTGNGRVSAEPATVTA